MRRVRLPAWEAILPARLKRANRSFLGREADKATGKASDCTARGCADLVVLTVLRPADWTPYSSGRRRVAMAARGPGMVQLGGHVGADGEADMAGGTVVSCIVSEPSKHAVLVACTVGAEEQLGHRSRQGLEAASDEGQVVHASGDVAVSVLVGDDEVLLGPVHGDGLVSNASFVMGHGLLLVAFLNRSGRRLALLAGVHEGPRARSDASPTARIAWLRRGRALRSCCCLERQRRDTERC